jgi:hypothetical protein
VDGGDLFDGLELDDDLILHEQVGAITAIEVDAAIDDWQFLLTIRKSDRAVKSYARHAS